MNQPAYLWKNTRGIYFFRARIPKQFSDFFNRTEIKKSLKTDSFRLALKLARAYRVELDKAMSKLEKGTYSAYQVALEAKTPTTQPNGEEKPVESKIERNLASLDELPALREHFLKQHEMEVKRQEEKAERQEERAKREKREEELHQTQLAAITTTPAPTSTQNQPEQQTEPSPPLSEIIKIYLDEGETLKRWKDRSKSQVEATLNLFADIVGGNTHFKSIDKAIARNFKQQYMKLPAYRNKPAYKGKTIAELLAMEIPKEDRLAHNTINNNIIRVSVLFNWAENQGYIDKNPLDGLTIGKKKRASEERQAFDQDDLIKLFESKEYKRGFKHPYQYWLPIIGLHTGMRLEEICRLQVNNFKQIDGINYILIGRDGEWAGKTDAALRIIPVHPKLCELKLLDYIDQLRANGKDRLFEELKPVNGEYGAAASKWFARYRKRCGIIDRGKVLHSFRHTLANEFKQRQVPLEVAEAIIGHESDSMTYGRYGKDYKTRVMFDAIKLVDYGLNHPHWNNP